MDITCNSCGSFYKVDKRYAGRKANCKKCDTALVIPKAPGLKIKKTIGEQRREVEAKRTRSCPMCGEEILEKAIKCKHCGEFLDGRKSNNSSPAIETGNGNPNNVVVNIDNSGFGAQFGAQRGSRRNYKTKNAALLWCFFLGGIGAHHFYLGNTVRGLLYLVFVWTYIPMVLALIDFILIACTSLEKFDRKYN